MSVELPAPLQTVCRVAGVSRSAACEQRRRRRASAEEIDARRRPGPVGALPDAELLAEIRRDLAESPFVGEGHRKVWALLRRKQGIRTSRKRVLRLTREAGLLAPTPQVRKRAARLHEGTITVSVPDTLWASDATEAWTRQEGRCAVFVLVDHASNEVWYDASRRMDRFAAADLLREVCAERFGSVEQAVACGLALRYDGGSCFRSDHSQAGIDHLGIARSPAFHYEPETNGFAEKAIQILKEQLLWIERFDTLDELRTAVCAFGRTYNQQWLIERHGYRTPSEAREHPRRQAAVPRSSCPLKSPVDRGRRRTVLHKLRLAMVRPGRESLSGVVEVDETYIGGVTPGRRGGGALGCPGRLQRPGASRVHARGHTNPPLATRRT